MAEHSAVNAQKLCFWGPVAPDASQFDSESRDFKTAITEVTENEKRKWTDY